MEEIQFIHFKRPGFSSRLIQICFVLPSGPLPPDPIRVLSAQKTKDLFSRAREEFDMVIFDTPPLLGLADALVVSAQTQGMLLTATVGPDQVLAIKCQPSMS